MPRWALPPAIALASRFVTKVPRNPVRFDVVGAIVVTAAAISLV